jgi:hypothetical protein
MKSILANGGIGRTTTVHHHLCLQKQDVANADVVGAHLKAYMDDFVIMKFAGKLVDILCKLNPTHNKFAVLEQGIKVLYVRLIKAIYGCVKSALLWYKVFTRHYRLWVLC